MGAAHSQRLKEGALNCLAFRDGHSLIIPFFPPTQSYYVKEKVLASRVKEDIVNYSKLKWPLLFSRFYEAFRSSGKHF